MASLRIWQIGCGETGRRYDRLFARAGEYTDNIPGSPVVAIQTALESSIAFTVPVQIKLIDIRNDRVSHLRKLVEHMRDELSRSERIVVDELIAPNRANRKPGTMTQDGRSLKRYKRRWTVERSIAWIQNFRRLCIRWKKSTTLFSGFLHLGCAVLFMKAVFGLASSILGISRPPL